MKLAIHYNNDPRNFCHGWIKSCEELGIEYISVDCLDPDILNTIKEYHGLLWHWYPSDRASMSLAPFLMQSVEMMGKIAIPNALMALSFDDKLAQNYILNSIGTDTVQTTVFYERDKALKFGRICELPIVHKLKGGAGSLNVSLITRRKELLRLIHNNFNRGSSKINYKNLVKDRLSRFKKNPSFSTFKSLSGGLLQSATNKFSLKKEPNDYVYFQKYLPNNSDIRIIVLGQKAIGIRRYNREGDFRASGSGNIVYNHKEIPLDCVRQGFNLSYKLKTPILAIDFISDGAAWKVVEMSYGFVSRFYANCEGYWDIDLTWRYSNVNTEKMLIESLIVQNEP